MSTQTVTVRFRIQVIDVQELLKPEQKSERRVAFIRDRLHRMFPRRTFRQTQYGADDDSDPLGGLPTVSDEEQLANRLEDVKIQ